MKADLQAEQTLLDQWVATEQADFLAWYNQMKDQLGEDAGNLQNQINKDEIKRILLVGFEDGKEFSEDGTVYYLYRQRRTNPDEDIYKRIPHNDERAEERCRRRSGESRENLFNADGSLISTVVTYS